jgi:hypothetical protein
MKIERYTHEYRNDFHAILKCEYCEHSQELKSGYHDDYYHKHVLPAIRCETCGSSSVSRTPQESEQ